MAVMQTQTPENPLNPPLPRALWIKRLTYRSWHRGCKETDVILGNFCDAHLAEMSDAELHIFEQFLDEDDAEIWAWLTEKTPCPNHAYTPMLRIMRTIQFSR
jgi:antitoxin CptB